MGIIDWIAEVCASELRAGLARQLANAYGGLATIGVGDDDGGTAIDRVAVDAFMGNIERLARAVEQVPQPLRREPGLGVGIGSGVGKLGHEQSIIAKKNLFLY